jgi:hypothetical protein
VPETPEASGSTREEDLRLRINQLEGELDRQRSQERLLAETLISATGYAAKIRESARRDAELALRKAQSEAERLKARAVRERDDARRELLRLHRITERTRNGLSEFLSAKVAELQTEFEEVRSSRQEDDLETALGSALRDQSQAQTLSSPEHASHPRPDVLARGGLGSTGGSPHVEE